MDRVANNLRFELHRTGAQGPRSPLPYPAGEYSGTVTYTATASIAPYVLFSGTYYVMNKEGSWIGTEQGTTPAQDYATNGSNATWVPFENFKAMFVEIFMANFAKLASAVFYEEFMFSQYGVKDGVATSDYSGFNDGSFTPNILLDFLKGAAAFGAGNVAFNADGTGYLSGGNIWWDVAGFIYSKSQLIQVYRLMNDELQGTTGNHSLDLSLGANLDVNTDFSDTRLLLLPAGDRADQIVSLRFQQTTRAAVPFRLYSANAFKTLTSSGDVAYYSYLSMARSGFAQFYWNGQNWVVDLDDVYSSSNERGKISLSNS